MAANENQTFSGKAPFASMDMHEICTEVIRSFGNPPFPKYTQSAASTKLLVGVKMIKSTYLYAIFQKFARGKTPDHMLRHYNTLLTIKTLVSTMVIMSLL